MGPLAPSAGPDEGGLKVVELACCLIRQVKSGNHLGVLSNKNIKKKLFAHLHCFSLEENALVAKKVTH